MSSSHCCARSSNSLPTDSSHDVYTKNDKKNSPSLLSRIVLSTSSPVWRAIIQLVLSTTYVEPGGRLPWGLAVVEGAEDGVGGGKAGLRLRDVGELGGAELGVTGLRGPSSLFRREFFLGGGVRVSFLRSALSSRLLPPPARCGQGSLDRLGLVKVLQQFGMVPEAGETGDPDNQHGHLHEQGGCATISRSRWRGSRSRRGHLGVVSW